MFSIVRSSYSPNGTKSRVSKGSNFLSLPEAVQCVAQFPAGTSFRPKKSKLGYFRWHFNSSSTEAIRQKNKHLRYQLMVLVGFLVEKRANKNGFCSGE